MSSKPCKQCDQNFHVDEYEKQFHARMEVPEPTHCSWCRQKRRLAQINQINLFQRKCDATGETIISNFPQNSVYPIHSQPHWWSDAVDGTDHGRDFDFTRPFFEQWLELSESVPRPALMTDFFSDENSAYTNYAGKNKNCYLIFDSDENWDCFYCYGVNGSTNTSDCYRCQKMELCYECVDSQGCYGCSFVFNSNNCIDSAFLNNCTGVRNCIMCSNLSHKEYHILNQPVPKEEFERVKASLSDREVLMKKLAEFQEYRLKFPQKFMRGFQNENCTGNHLVQCKDAIFCFDSMNVWNGKYCYQMFMNTKDCLDVDEGGEAELLYECSNVGYNAYELRFCKNCLEQPTRLTYCDYCFGGCQDLFGCVGLKKKKFCILNKQYTQEEYEALVPKIIEHMKSTGEWGEFFPVDCSPFEYNLSMAQDHFPLNKEQALSLGHDWRDEDKKDFAAQTCTVPAAINDVDESICNEILACESCGKNYKIVKEELASYKKRGLPVPTMCFHCRHGRRLGTRTRRGLWQRNCDKCSAEIWTAYSPDRPETVYCEQCYLNEVY
jgi:hypothetical protein